MYNREVDFQSLLAFFPRYGSMGLETQLVYPDTLGQRGTSIRSLVKMACRSYALDRQALKNAARFISGRPNLVPLPLSLGRTFAPIKNITPLVKGDCAYGYYLLQAIIKVEKREQGSLLVLQGGIELEVAQSKTVVLNHVARAVLFERMFWSKRLGKDYI